MMRFCFCVLLWVQAVIWVQAAEVLPVEISAADPKIRYVGRWDWQEPLAPRAAWSASRVLLKFNGKDLNVKIKDHGKNFWQVIVDGKPTLVLPTLAGESLYRVAEGLPAGEHVVELVKRTEANLGVTQILGFQVGEGVVLQPVEALPRRLEVIGDSISCGYGNEGASEKEHFLPQTENGNIAYGALAAREVGAEYMCVAWSGKKMWPNNTIPEIYDRILPADPASAKWDFSKWQPDAVVINLATNDFAGKNPEEEGWVKAYREFVVRVRKNYPHARIYCAIGSMMSDQYPKGNMALTTLRGYLGRVVSELNATGEKNVAILEFAQQKPSNGIGSDWHPGAKTHQIMGEQLAATLKKDLGW